MNQNILDRTETRSDFLMSHCPTCGGGDIETQFSSLSVSRCAECRMLFRNPQPAEEELNRFYKCAFCPDNVLLKKTGMEGTTGDLASQYVAFLAASIGIEGKAVLEFGAGLGITCRALRHAGADVTAVEPFAWRECGKSGIPTYRSLEELPKGFKFDVILSLQVVEHLSSPLVTLRELHSRLAPGGWLYLATPNADSLRARLHGARWKALAKFGHLMFYTPSTLERALRQAGFDACVRVKSYVRYGHNPGRMLAHYALHCAGLEGELRFLAQAI